MSDADDALLDFLRQTHLFLFQKALPEGYTSKEGLVYRFGLTFTPRERPPSIEKMEFQQCFANVIDLISRHPDLTYVEGYASGSILPVHHAWAVTANGEVVDPTWEPMGLSYIGIPMNLDFVLSYIARRGYYGVLDDWQQNFPILRGDIPLEAFFHSGFTPPRRNL